jgi:hypothetical protein
MDDLHWFVSGFYTKRVAGIQKLSEVGDMLTVCYTLSSLYGVLKLLVWEKNGGFGWVTKTLCTQNEANAFSLWNNNLGYQGILEWYTQSTETYPPFIWYMKKYCNNTMTKFVCAEYIYTISYSEPDTEYRFKPIEHQETETSSVNYYNRTKTGNSAVRRVCAIFRFVSPLLIQGSK